MYSYTVPLNPYYGVIKKIEYYPDGTIKLIEYYENVYTIPPVSCPIIYSTLLGSGNW